jgi:L-serine dehydratase
VKTSLFDLFKLGIGPSSSHTMGPMRAARTFVLALQDGALLQKTTAVQAELYGSLALTGLGHGTDRAVLLGLLGDQAATIDPDTIDGKLAHILQTGTLSLLGQHAIAFDTAAQLMLHRDTMTPPGARTQHPNGMRFTASDAQGATLLESTYFSIGGGFIVEDGEDLDAQPLLTTASLPFPFASAAELLQMAAAEGKTIAEIVFINECSMRSAEQVRAGVLGIWAAMRACMERGIVMEGILPGGLNVRRRAPRQAGGSSCAARLDNRVCDGGE